MKPITPQTHLSLQYPLRYGNRVPKTISGVESHPLLQNTPNPVPAVAPVNGVLHQAWKTLVHWLDRLTRPIQPILKSIWQNIGRWADLVWISHFLIRDLPVLLNATVQGIKHVGPWLGHLSQLAANTFGY